MWCATYIVNLCVAISLILGILEQGWPRSWITVVLVVGVIHIAYLATFVRKPSSSPLKSSRRADSHL